MTAPQPCTIPVVIVLLELLVSNRKTFLLKTNLPKRKVLVFFIFVIFERQSKDVKFLNMIFHYCFYFYEFFILSV